MPAVLWDVRAALFTVFGGIADLDVFDGPMTRTTPPRQFLLVGTEGEFPASSASDDGASADQSASSLSGSNMWDETGEIVCAAWAWSGGTDFAPLRVAARGIVDAAEGLVMADRTLGGVLAPPGLAWFSGLRLREVQTTSGAFVRAAFTIAYQALVTN